MELEITNHESIQEVIDFSEQSPQPNLLQQPLIRKLINAFGADLLLSEKKEKYLELIRQYLFENHPLRQPALRKDLPEDLYLALYALKSAMRDHKLDVVAEHLKTHKELTLRWIAIQTEEE